MCGIVGKVNFDRSPVDVAQIRHMADAVRHRGPDDDGFWVDGIVGLGHRRLSIIDLSDNGHNPMTNEDGMVWIVFNGEIYNFRELRSQLEGAGHKFKSHTDTEVILHLYEDYGEDCVLHLRGMFAFAIWDRRSRKLLLARDRMGVKPLYYSQNISRIIFGSEIKAVLASREVASTPDYSAIHDFLSWQYIASPKTAYQQIKKLPPASVLVWQEESGLVVKKYWDLQPQEPFRESERELADQVRELTQRATAMRLVADVPLGLFLSGGLDSACVLAATRKATSDKIRTFSITFGQKEYDESKFARLLARYFETDHEEFRVTPDVMSMLPQMACLFDEPFGDLASIPTYYLSKLTRQYVTVALSGDGGDEAFGGYDRYFALKVLRQLSHVPGSTGLAKLRFLLPYSSAERSRLRYLRELLGLAGIDAREQYAAIFLGMFGPQQWKSLYTQSFRKLLDKSHSDAELPWDHSWPGDDLDRAMLSDTRSYIPECLNTKVDICSMACALEVRSPFLDHELVEFCARIPGSLKIRGVNQKYILKQAFKNQIPEEILHRGKTGFGLPIASWFRNEMRESARESLLASDSKISEIFEVSEIKRMFEEHISGKRNWHIQLWRVLVLENWLQAGSTKARASVA